MTTDSAKLREAAASLRMLAQAALNDLDTNDYWGELADYADGVRGGLGGPAGDLAAAFTPSVALALATHLDTTGTVIERTGRDWPGAFEGEKSVAAAIHAGGAR